MTRRARRPGWRGCSPCWRLVSACSTTGSSGSVLGTLADPRGGRPRRPGRRPRRPDAVATVTVPSTTTSSSAPPPPPPAEVTATPADGAEGVDPLAPVTVAVAKGTLESVRLTNPDGVEVPGTLAADKLSWTAQTELGYGQDLHADDVGAQLVRGVVERDHQHLHHGACRTTRPRPTPSPPTA